MYKEHLRRIARKLPPALRQFSKDVNVHDGLFRKVVLCPSEGRLTVKLRCGDLQVGYSNLDMVFDGVSLPAENRKQLRSVVNRKKTQLLYDEVDVADCAAFCYRFICWPEGEVTIRFSEFSYRKTPVKSRQFRAANPRFRVATRRSGPITKLPPPTNAREASISTNCPI